MDERDSSLTYYPDGKTEVRYRRVAGRNGGKERIEYFPNGKVRSSTMQLRGVKDGACKSWYENGKRKSSVTYSGDLADGEYFAWNSRGILVAHAWADHGVDTLEYVFNNTGQPIIAIGIRQFFSYAECIRED
jgi:antitoxin component YwqK of YwqJK toxin-antitoxin module